MTGREDHPHDASAVRDARRREARVAMIAIGAFILVLSAVVTVALPIGWAYKLLIVGPAWGIAALVAALVLRKS